MTTMTRKQRRMILSLPTQCHHAQRCDGVGQCDVVTPVSLPHLLISLSHSNIERNYIERILFLVRQGFKMKVVGYGSHLDLNIVCVWVLIRT